MKNTLSIRKALRAFQTIKEKGECMGGTYRLEGLRAESGFDGYSATIYTQRARLEIYFHNTFSFKFNSGRDKALFLEKLDLVDGHSR